MLRTKSSLLPASALAKLREVKDGIPKLLEAHEKRLEEALKEAKKATAAEVRELGKQEKAKELELDEPRGRDF